MRIAGALLGLLDRPLDSGWIALGMSAAEIDNVRAVGNRFAGERRKIAQLGARSFEQVKCLGIVATISLVIGDGDPKAALASRLQPRIEFDGQRRRPVAGLVAIDAT